MTEFSLESPGKKGAREVEVSLVFRHFHPILAGAAERFRRYSSLLGDQGIRYEVYTLREEGVHAELEEMHEALRVRRITTEGKPWERDAALFEAAWARLREVSAGGHVVQTSLAHDLAAPWLRRIRKHGVGCLYVGTMAGAEDEVLPGWRRLIRKLKNRRNFQPFHRVVASTTVMARWFERTGIAPERIVIIPNGVDVHRFHPVADREAKRQLKETLGLRGDGPVVIFAGSIVPRKGVDLLIRAWPRVLAQVPDARLVLVGGFERPTFMTKERMEQLTRFQRDVRDMAHRPECRGSVTFAGETDRVDAWLRASDVFVFPSEQEGMGNVVLEAMASELPCVITKFHGLPEEEFGTAGKEFTLVARTDADLAAGLCEKLTQPQTAELMGKAARAWACEHLDVRLTIERYARLYRQLAF